MPKPTDSLRKQISAKTRNLRTGRGWTQTDLAKKLGVSQNWISKVEKGDASFTAEQFLILLRLFNATTEDFVAPSPSDSELQNALARLGASHLQRVDHVLPSSKLHDVHQVLVEALVDGSGRVVTATAPVLLRNVTRLNLAAVHKQLTDLGLGGRLPWAVDNTVEAIGILRERDPKWGSQSEVRSAAMLLRMFTERLRNARGRGEIEKNFTEDVVDGAIRSLKTISEVRNTRSAVSENWAIISRLQPQDFVEALEAAR